MADQEKAPAKKLNGGADAFTPAAGDWAKYIGPASSGNTLQKLGAAMVGGGRFLAPPPGQSGTAHQPPPAEMNSKRHSRRGHRGSRGGQGGAAAHGGGHRPGATKK